MLKHPRKKPLTILSVIVLIIIAYLAYVQTNSSLLSSKVNSLTNNPIVSVTESKENKYDKEEIFEIVKEYIMANPQVMIQSLQDHQQKEMLEKQRKAKEALENNQDKLESSATAPIIGNAKAKKTVVFFFDYTCGYCKKQNEELKSLMNKDVKIVHKMLPILGDSAAYLAKVALIVHNLEPTKYVKVHEAFMNLKNVTKEAVKDIIAQQGIDYSKIEENFELKPVREELAETAAFAANIGLHGTPALLVKGQMFPGLVKFEEVKKALD